MLMEELFPGHHDHGAIACRSRTLGRSLQSRVYGRAVGPSLRRDGEVPLDRRRGGTTKTPFLLPEVVRRTLTSAPADSPFAKTATGSAPDEFGFVNEQRAEDGSWVYIDEWRFRRKTCAQL